MRKAVFAVPLLTLLNPLINPIAPSCADDQDTPLDIDEVLVTGSPLGRTSETFTHPANLLTGNELQESAAATLGETLSDQAGLASASFGPGVGIPIIRGQTDNRVKVMQDSIGSMDASSASPDHAITLEPLLATRIEVLRGPAALRYGSGAVGGVVNVINERIPDESPQGIDGALETRFSTANDEASVVAKMKAGGDRFAVYADGVSRTSNNLRIPGNSVLHPDSESLNTQGYIANTNADYHEGTFGASYLAEDGFIGFSINQLTNNYGVPPSEEAQVRIEMEQTREDMKGEWREPSDWIEKLSFRLGHNDYQHQELEDGSPGTRFTNNATEGRAELVHTAWGIWQGALGVQASSSDFAAIGDEAFIPSSQINNQGIFWLEEARLAPFTLELGVRLEQQTIHPDLQATRQDHSLNLSSSLSWEFDENQKISVALARSQRAPSVEELYADGPHPATHSYLIGDSQLELETSVNTELGYHWHDENIEFNASFFFNRIQNFIYTANQQTAIDDLDLYHYQQDKAKFRGGELEFVYKPDDIWRISLLADLVRAQLDSGADLPRIPTARWGGAIDYDLGSFSAGLSVKTSADQTHPGAYELSTEGYSQVDFNMSYAISPKSRVFLKGKNLLNEDIRNASSYLRAIAPEAGRNWTCGFEQRF